MIRCIFAKKNNFQTEQGIHLEYTAQYISIWEEHLNLGKHASLNGGAIWQEFLHAWVRILKFQ